MEEMSSDQRRGCSTRSIISANICSFWSATVREILEMRYVTRIGNNPAGDADDVSFCATGLEGIHSLNLEVTG